jgi:hypothetical protein
VPTVQHAIDVAGTPDDCWRIFSDLATWANWFPMLRSVRGELRSGGRLVLSFGAGPAIVPVTVTIQEFVPLERVRWIGGALGVRGDHSYTFVVNNPGTTRVTSRECFSGLGSRLLAGPVFARLDGEVHDSMGRFKALVEATRP